MIELQPFDKTDFARLISWIDSEETLLQFTGGIFKYPLTHEQLENYLKDENRIVFKVLNMSTNEVIGHAEILIVNDTCVKICRLLIGNNSLRGQGYGQGLMKALIEYAVNKLKVESVELNVYDWNVSAIKCYEKVGFKANSSKSKMVKLTEDVEWFAVNMVYKP